jgi:hypothetical protein
VGGLAALYLAVAYLVAMPFFLVVVDYPSVTDPVRKVALLAANHGSMQLMYLVTYVVFGLALAVLALALHARLKQAAPAVMQVATAVGLLWAFILVASGMVFNAGMAAAVTLYSTSPEQAVTLWQAVEPVALGLGGAGGELLGGLWVLLVSIAGLRAARAGAESVVAVGFSKPLGWLGMTIGVAGIASVVPALNSAAYVFGLLQIAWFVWVGVTMLRGAERREAVAAPRVEAA